MAYLKHLKCSWGYDVMKQLDRYVKEEEHYGMHQLSKFTAQIVSPTAFPTAFPTAVPIATGPPLSRS